MSNDLPTRSSSPNPHASSGHGGSGKRPLARPFFPARAAEPAPPQPPARSAPEPAEEDAGTGFVPYDPAAGRVSPPRPSGTPAAEAPTGGEKASFPWEGKVEDAGELVLDDPTFGGMPWEDAPGAASESEDVEEGESPEFADTSGDAEAPEYAEASEIGAGFPVLESAEPDLRSGSERIAEDETDIFPTDAFFLPDEIEDATADEIGDRSTDVFDTPSDEFDRPRRETTAPGAGEQARAAIPSGSADAIELARRLEAFARRLRSTGEKALESELESSGRLERLLAAVLSGYVAGRRGDGR